MRGNVQPYKVKDSDTGEWRPVRNRYKLVIDLGRHDGKRAREVRHFRGGKREAEAALGDWLAELRKAGRAVAPVRGTVGEWLDEWLRDYIEPKVREQELAASTLASYEGTIRRYLKPELGSIELKRLKPEDVTRLYNTMAQSKDESGYGVSARTRELTHVTLRASLKKAVELRRVRVNVLEQGHGVDRPQVKNRRAVNALEESEALALLTRLAEADGPDARLFLPAYLALATGMRRGEILALTWDAVKLPPSGMGLVTVSRAWDTGSTVGVRSPLERYRLKGPKNGRERFVDVGPDVVAVLRAAKAEHATERLAADAWLTGVERPDGSRLEWGDLVVSDEHGVPWWPDSFSSAWHAYCKREGVVCRFHDLRATSLSLALAGGADAEQVRTRAGHHSAAFFLERYAKAMHRARERDAGIINSLVAQVPQRTGTNNGHQVASGR